LLREHLERGSRERREIDVRIEHVAEERELQELLEPIRPRGRRS
jgi:hypothetical protein